MLELLEMYLLLIEVTDQIYARCEWYWYSKIEAGTSN